MSFNEIKAATDALNEAVMESLTLNEYEVLDSYTLKLSNGTLIEGLRGANDSSGEIYDWQIMGISLCEETRGVIGIIVSKGMSMKINKIAIAKINAAVAKFSKE